MTKIIKIFILVTLFTFSFMSVTHAAANSCATVGVDRDKANSLFRDLNAYRKAHNMPALRRTSYLNQLAAHKGYEYSLSKEWAHDINGKTWIQIYQECGLRYKKIGENLIRNSSRSSQVIEYWHNTPTHKSNMLDRKYKSIGIFVGGPEIDYYTVAVFMN